MSFTYIDRIFSLENLSIGIEILYIGNKGPDNAIDMRTTIGQNVEFELAKPL